MSGRRKSVAERQAKRAAQPKPALPPPAPTDRVVIAYIHPGQTSAYFTHGLVNLLMYDQATSRRVVGCLNEWSSANVSAARNSLTQRFVDDYPQADWLLWVDADMAFDHEALDRLLASADPVRAPIVGGLCFGATFGQLFPTIYQFVTDDDDKICTVRMDDYPDDTLIPCAATGAAFVLIHRRVFEEMREAEFNVAFPWFQETELAGNPSGEDITFMLRAGLLKFPIHVDTGVRIGHHKSTVLDHDTFRAQQEASGGSSDGG